MIVDVRSSRSGVPRDIFLGEHRRKRMAHEMAYSTPKVLLTTKRRPEELATCPSCGRGQVTLYFATDVARCQVCSRVWHPSDRFYADRHEAFGPEQGSGSGDRGRKIAADGQSTASGAGTKRKRRRRRRRNRHAGA